MPLCPWATNSWSGHSILAAFILNPGHAGPAPSPMQRLETEGLAWAPTLGNLATLTSFVLAVVENNQITGGCVGLAFGSLSRSCLARRGSPTYNAWVASLPCFHMPP